MKLLVSNDDGVFASGIRALADTLAQAGYSVTVVCPDQERSATGHSLTLHQPIRAEVVEGVFHPAVKAWACSGTPSDSVKLALWTLLPQPPDLILSGINHGPNLGTDILYSGTVSAAMEGLIEGIPSAALSLGSYTSRDFGPAAQFALDLVRALEANPLTQLVLLNVNIPAVPAGEIAGVKVVRQGVRRYRDVFEKRQDPRGRSYYWLAGELIEDDGDGDGATTDVMAIQEKFITVTPLDYNLTSLAGLNLLKDHQLLCPDL